MLTRSNKRNVNVVWEPFATSTPLKIVRDNVNCDKESKKQLLVRTDSLDIIKKLQKGCSPKNGVVEKPSDIKVPAPKRHWKNKSLVNYDFSSSDEDTREKRRPVIKLSLKKQRSSLLKSKKSDEDNKVVTSINTSAKPNNCRTGSSETSKCEVQGLQENYEHALGNNEENHIDNSNSDDECQIFDKVADSGCLTNTSKFSLEKREDTRNISMNDENVKLTGKNKFKINKSGKFIKIKQKTCIPKAFPNPKNPEISGRLNIENEVCKKKVKNVKNSVSSVKKFKSKKARSNSPTAQTVDNAATPLHAQENRSNISHQLFSDSRGQELINTLDLTSEEVCVAKGTKDIILWQKENKSNQSSLASLHLLNHKNLAKRIVSNKRHNPKHFFLNKNLSTAKVNSNKQRFNDAEEQFNQEKNSQSHNINDEIVQEFQATRNIEEINKCTKSPNKSNLHKIDLGHKNTGRKVKKKVNSKIEKKKEACTFNNVSSNIKNNKVINSDDNGDENDLESGESIPKNQKLSEALKCVEEKKTPVEKPLFKLMNELSFNENGTGCSAVECWDVNTFKCGVFKLKMKSQMNCKTLHSNSHLGGVLVKGHLRMKIGSKELELNQGDMAFVPPLTEWEAENIGKSESVFYYWCGRFKT